MFMQTCTISKCCDNYEVNNCTTDPFCELLSSLLVVETADRPGLLVDLVKIITDINITVQSGEFDTEV